MYAGEKPTLLTYIRILVKAWLWRSRSLPLHHAPPSPFHGSVNTLCEKCKHERSFLSTPILIILHLSLAVSLFCSIHWVQNAFHVSCFSTVLQLLHFLILCFRGRRFILQPVLSRYICVILGQCHLMTYRTCENPFTSGQSFQVSSSFFATIFKLLTIYVRLFSRSVSAFFLYLCLRKFLLYLPAPSIFDNFIVF